MDDRVSKYLYDILSAINETLEETDIRGRKFEILAKDRVYRKFDSLDKEIIWGIIIKHLPILKSEVEKLLS